MSCAWWPGKKKSSRKLSKKTHEGTEKKQCYVFPESHKKNLKKANKKLAKIAHMGVFFHIDIFLGGGCLRTRGEFLCWNNIVCFFLGHPICRRYVETDVEVNLFMIILMDPRLKKKRLNRLFISFLKNLLPRLGCRLFLLQNLVCTLIKYLYIGIPVSNPFHYPINTVLMHFHYPINAVLMHFHWNPVQIPQPLPVQASKPQVILC